MVSVSIAADVRSTLGESPVWSSRTQTLYHCDISGKKVFATVDGRTLPPLLLPVQVGCVVPRSRGGLLLCLESDIRPASVESAFLGEPVLTFPATPGVRFNDGKADPQGRLWVGTMHSSWRDPASPPGQLYVVRPGTVWSAPTVVLGSSPWLLGGGAVVAAAASLALGSVRARGHAALGATAVAAAALAAAALASGSAAGLAGAAQPSATAVVPGRLPNGMTWSADGRTMYWIDSASNAVDAFAFDGASGELSKRRVVVRCPRQGAGVHGSVGGIPDGMTIDASGKLWVVLGESGSVVQYDPATGREITAVKLPVQRPTACTFGGADLSQLFITTREEGAKGSSNAGSLFKVQIPGVRGLHAAYECGI